MAEATITTEAIYEALKTVYDPEIPVNVVDLGLVYDVQVKDIDLYIHQQGIDTATMTGKMMFQMCGVFAEFERNIIRERVKSGLDRAKKSGQKLGRPTNVSENTKATVIELRNTGMSLNKISKTLSIGSGTLYRLLEEVA